MQQDPFNTHAGDIFQKSQCINLENSLMNFFQNNLIMLGYDSIEPSRKIWQRGNKTVVVCLVDDVISCASDYDKSISNLFDSNTVVITDNKINAPTEYKVLNLPDSFFGIYHYKPDNFKFDPIKLVNLSVNRVDPIRQLILLELIAQTKNHDDYFNDIHVNFNCFAHGTLSTKNQFIDNFKNTWDILFSDVLIPYQSIVNNIAELMPIKNHNLTLEESSMSACVNMVIETYSGNDVVALSEKTFRALVTPSPWTVYSGRHTVGLLKSLGFDVLDDIVDHTYSHKTYNESIGPASKSKDYVIQSLVNADRVKDNRSVIGERCLHAAEKNQQLLFKMRQAWPADFATWWSNNVQYVA